MAVRFFLGANSPTGFYSFYDWLIDLETAQDVLILKGGPGCGKSSYMNRVSQRVEEAGFAVEYIHCASDPQSLDGVIFPELKTAIVDGTAPHVVEPRFPAAIERYVNLGEFYDLEPIKAKREEIRGLILSKKAPYERVTRCLSAARSLEDDMFNTVIDDKVIHTLVRRARGIISREIRQGQNSIVKKRFLSGVTPQGLVCHFETAQNLCERLYVLGDNYGLAHFMLAPIMNAAQEAGQEIYACYDPMNPENKLVHLLLPGLGLGFITSSDLMPYEGPSFRRVRLDAVINIEKMRRMRGRLRFLRKTEYALIDDVSEALAEAHSEHEKLEACYNPHMDFKRMYEAAEQTAAHLLNG